MNQALFGTVNFANLTWDELQRKSVGYNLEKI